MNILKLMTGSITGEFMMESPISNGWAGVSGFLLFLLAVIVYTTSVKSVKIKQLEQKIKELGGKIR